MKNLPELEFLIIEEAQECEHEDYLNYLPCPQALVGLFRPSQEGQGQGGLL